MSNYPKFNNSRQNNSGVPFLKKSKLKKRNWDVPIFEKPKSYEEMSDEEKEALNDRIDALKKFYDKQKDLLNDKLDEEKYLTDQAEKRKAVEKIEAYKTNSIGVKYCKEILKAVATVDQKNIAISAYLYA